MALDYYEVMPHRVTLLGGHFTRGRDAIVGLVREAVKTPTRYDERSNRPHGVLRTLDAGTNPLNAQGAEMQSSNECWLPVAGYEGKYAISDHGRVKSLARRVWNGRAYARHPERILKTTNAGHYPKVNLRDGASGKKVYVHDLVLTHFVGEKPEGAYARHLDDDNTNNHISNLSWGTPSDNSYDKVRNGNDHYARRTHCVNGHEFTPDNIYRRAEYPGTRYCKQCRQDAQRNRGSRTDYKRQWRANRRTEGKPVT